MRVATGRPLNLSHTFLDDDEETPLALSAVTVTLTDADGNTAASGSATDAGSGVWEFSAPAQPLGVYVATWVGDTTHTETDSVEVVAGFLFTVARARKKKPLDDAATYPGAEIIQKRDQVETEFQKIAGRSFTTRLKVYDFVSDGTGEEWQLTPDSQAIESATVDDLAVADLSGWSISKLGTITYPCLDVPEGSAVRVRIRYGFTTPPDDVVRVALVRLADLINQEDSGMPDRTTTWQPDEGGTYRLATPGAGPWETGIPEVDATVKRYRLDTVLSVYGIG